MQVQQGSTPAPAGKTSNLALWEAEWVFSIQGAEVVLDFDAMRAVLKVTDSDKPKFPALRCAYIARLVVAQLSMWVLDIMNTQ